jgi:hypothetical protein
MIAMTATELEMPLASLNGHDFVYYHEGGEEWFTVREKRMSADARREELRTVAS